MKHLILGTVSAAALLLAGQALAQNFTQVNQIGDNNAANVTQGPGQPNTAEITQVSYGNTATVTETGTFNSALIYQDTDGSYSGSTATVSQLGDSGFVDARQYGYNSFTLTQAPGSFVTSLYLRQTGYNPNGGVVSQSGVHNNAWVLQTGQLNISSVTQTGNGDGYAGPIFENTIPGTLNADDFGVQSGAGSQQVGNYNTSTIEQDGSASEAITEATGSGNNQSITQYASTNQATVFALATGNSNTATIWQYAGAAYSANNQYGYGNSITVQQQGNVTSLIGQGTHVSALGVGPNDGPQAAYAQANVYQAGSGHFSKIEQFSSAAASVSQINNEAGGNDTSTVLQYDQANYADARVYQAGLQGESAIQQDASADYADVTQNDSSQFESSGINQTGANDTAIVIQNGNSDTSNITQTGYVDTVNTTQNGTSGISFVTQSGNYNNATIFQSAGTVGAESHITQSGSGNSVNVHQ